MTDNKRSIELEIEVPGTPDEVWQAIATGPGITSWYVPHEVEERKGGAMSASFGDGPEMQVSGRVAEWDPPRRALFDGGDADEGMAFEWFVEARDGGTCIVRLVNSGFGGGGEWDDHFDAMFEGWQLFLSNLRLHLQHFAGQSAHVRLPMAMVATDVATAWETMTARLGIASSFAPGDHIELEGEGVPAFVGTVAETMQQGTQQEHKVLFVVEEPAPGTAFIASENHGPVAGVSIWLYLYDESGRLAVERDGPKFQGILDEIAGSFTEPDESDL